MNSNWKVRTLDEICNVVRGGSPRPIQDFLTDSPDGVNWVKISDATASKKYIYETKERIRPEGVSRSRLVKSGDFLLSNSMSFGRPYIMRTSGCVHDGWLVLSDKSGLFDQDYLYHFFSSRNACNQFDQLAAGSTVRNLNIDSAKKVKILLPSIAEQKRIVAILDEAFEEVDAAAANTQKNLTSARELFENFVNSVVTQKGEGWAERTLSKIGGDVYTGPFGSLLHKADYLADGIPLVNPANIIDGKIVPDREKTVDVAAIARLQNYRLRKGDVVIGRRGEIGRCAVVTAVEEGWLCGTGCFCIRVFRETSPFFLAHLLRSKPYRERLEALSTGATMLNLSNTALSGLSICLPNLKEQEGIAMRIEALSSHIQDLESINRQKLATLAELKQSILQKAFAGELPTRSEEAVQEAAE